MTSNYQEETKRYSFEKVSSIQEIPHLLDIQKGSFSEFLQKNVASEERNNIGLQASFNNIFPIEGAHGNYMLEFKYYTIGEPRYNVQECIDRGVSYTVPLKVRLVLHVREEDTEKGEYSTGIEQDVFFGNIPNMTQKGTFVFNGAERIIVSQIQRSPGVFFDEGTHSSGNTIYTARIIPKRGSWVDFIVDHRDIIYTVIDRRHKFPATILLRAFGYETNEEILTLLNAGERIDISTKKARKEAQGRVLADSLVDPETGEVVYDLKDLQEVDDEILEICEEHDIQSLLVFTTEDDIERQVFVSTFRKDSATFDKESALYFLYKNLRTGEPPNMETAEKYIKRMFFSPKKYDLGRVGRYRMNEKFDLDVPVEDKVLTKDDFIEIVKHIIYMKKGDLGPDDIDHLGNRRVRTICEQMENQFNIALNRMSRTIKERMNLRESENLTPQNLINSRIITSVLNTFFGTGQLSQYLEQTNPLAETTHKRRTSALGPGGLTRERAGFEVRDVHYTHYGRICPIETPEGPNIGLITSLASYAHVNDLGFLETPYRKVEKQNGKSRVTEEVHYLSADDEDREMIAQANSETNEDGYFVNDTVRCRIKGEVPVVDQSEVTYMDVSPQQLVSASSALIPFLEHDDANRALMGSNMQRQATPLLFPEKPVVGTGMESTIARDSYAAIISPKNGVVEEVDGAQITIKSEEKEEIELDENEGRETIKLEKYARTNQDSAVNQRPIVKEGDKVKKGQVVADGCSTDQGELALGKNVMVAYMSWGGYNFEDAIIISERLVKDDVFTSVHIKEFELEVRDTKRGREELTREIPNVSEEATKHLDKDGIIREGARVSDNDIIIGKVTPKGKTDPTPEEKLLRAIFGDKASDVKDASKRGETGVEGIALRTKLFQRKTRRTRKKDKKKIEQIRQRTSERHTALTKRRNEILIRLLKDKKARSIKNLGRTKTKVRAGTKLTEKRLRNLNFDALSLESDWSEDEETNKKVKNLFNNYFKISQNIDEESERKIYKIKVGDDLQPGVIQLAKAYIADKKKIKVGDKMAGRHGNKGVISIIVPEEDMPFTDDGTPIDIILNPLGVPSRMNLGQLYEAMLGMAGYEKGVDYETPVFNGASYDEVKQELRDAGLPENCKTILYDGKTGEAYDDEVLVGYTYMMKLHHLVDEKMHARSTGPYSLVTQQPLGGKAQFGGQRLGEMEVWALEAYGAAYTLQEMLTIKSDDVEGRSRAYNSIVKGENIEKFGVPESFNVLVRELQGLCIELDIK